MDILEPGIRSDFGQEPDMADILDAEMFGSPCGLPTSDNYMDNDDWLDRLFEDPVLNDKMITEAVQPPRIQSEHSYSMHNDPIHASGLELPKLEDFADEMDTEFFGSSSSPLDLSQKAPSSPEQTVTVKQEMAVEDFVFTQSAACPSSTSSITFANDPRPPTIVLATGKANSILQPKSERFFLPKTIKLEPADIDHHSSDSGLDLLPPTPPSSASSDSEGSLSPGRSAPSSPIRESKHHTLSKPFSQPLFTSPIPTSGILILSEEEKRTLITEGYPVPSKLPLTKQEEKNLKKIRRKIKNKISAQESRRKKKEYLETLEKRVENYTQENNDLKRKVDSLENNNRSLLSQLQKLQAIVGKITRPSATTTQTGTVLMVVVLCFAIFVGGGWAPLSLNVGYSSGVSGPAEGEGALFSNPRPVHPSPTMGPLPQRVRVMEQYSTPTKKSRVLLSLKDDIDDLYGPRVPDSGWRCDQGSESENLEYTPAVESVRNLEDTKDGEVVKQADNTNTPTVESGTILEKTPAAETQSTGQVVTLDPRVLTENQTSDGGDSQALMHPDISAPADFLSADHLLNATAVNESA